MTREVLHKLKKLAKKQAPELNMTPKNLLAEWVKYWNENENKETRGLVMPTDIAQYVTKVEDK